ncbi:transposase [Methylobacter psychrophilus]|uniref:transposase n=1 Tax=Methylobacter psychrophilus TaxID=96941 RepID=UPI002948BC9A|nr:transposase [Methylobacter psychrophilus]
MDNQPLRSTRGLTCKARQRLPLQELKNATTAAGLRLHNQALAAWKCKGYNVVLTDGATVQMPDTPQNQADFPQLDNQKPGLSFPIARRVVLISLVAGTLLDYSLRARDHLLDWTKPKRKPVWISKQDYSDLPESINVREFTVNGRIYLTTVLNAKHSHKQELAMVYKQRWKIELDFRSIKTNMGMEILRCKTTDIVSKEIAIYLLAYNIIRGNLVQTASLHEN